MIKELRAQSQLKDDQIQQQIVKLQQIKMQFQHKNEQIQQKEDELRLLKGQLQEVTSKLKHVQQNLHVRYHIVDNEIYVTCSNVYTCRGN